MSCVVSDRYERVPPVPPPPYLTPRAVNAGVLSVLARVDRTLRAKTLASFIDMGIRLAMRA